MFSYKWGIRHWSLILFVVLFLPTPSPVLHRPLPLSKFSLCLYAYSSITNHTFGLFSLNQVHIIMFWLKFSISVALTYSKLSSFGHIHYSEVSTWRFGNTLFISWFFCKFLDFANHFSLVYNLYMNLHLHYKCYEFMLNNNRLVQMNPGCQQKNLRPLYTLTRMNGFEEDFLHVHKVMRAEPPV